MGEPILEGCLDQSACNHAADATVDDGSCTYAQENYDCSGNCIASDPNDCCDAGEVPDCNGTCGGSAIEDCAGACNGNAVISGCDNVCGSTLENDVCNVCGGDDSTCNISYSGFVHPTFISNGCTGCHGTNGGLNLSTYNNLMQGGNSGEVIIPGEGSNSLLIRKLRATAPGNSMPFGACCLDDNGAPTIDLIESWIDEGALNN